MIMRDLFHLESEHSKVAYFWYGQVVDESTWVGNINPEFHKRDDIPGFGNRYKVKVIGRDSQVKIVPDDQLEMAEVCYPVTGGSGHAGAHQTATLRQGSYVVGWYKDGLDGTEPIILGTLGNNAQTRLEQKDPEVGFIPRTGFKGKDGQKKISTTHEYASPREPREDGSTSVHSYTVKDDARMRDGLVVDEVPKTYNCEGTKKGIKSTQDFIKKTLFIIDRIQREYGNAINTISSVSRQVSNLVDKATDFVSGAVKGIMSDIRGYINKKINAGISDVVNFLPPNLRNPLDQAANLGKDTISCVMNKIIQGLVRLARRLIDKLINKYINAPLCAAEDFIGNMLGKITTPILGAVSTVLGGINGLVGSISSFAGKVFDVFKIVSGILNFLSCDEKPYCEQASGFSFWKGSTDAVGKFSDDLSDKMEKASESINGLLGENEGSDPGCSSRQIPCGPPKVEVTGGNPKVNAVGNAVIGVGGEIMGIDFSNFGSGFVDKPRIEIIDECNTGGGGDILARVVRTGEQDEETGKDIYKIEDGVVLDSGTSYLGGYNQTTGGNGDIFTRECDTILFNKNGKNILSTVGEVAEVVPGDELYLPVGSVVNIITKEGIVGQTVTGRGQTKRIEVEVYGTFSAPGCPPDTITTPQIPTIIDVIRPVITPGTPGIPTVVENPDPNGNPISIPETTIPVIESSLDYDNVVNVIKQQEDELEEYSVVLTIKDIYIKDPGVNYTGDEEIVIDEPNGAQLTPIFEDGKVVDVKVINPGIGFIKFPELTIPSETGYNAELIPVFEITRLTDYIKAEKERIILDAQVIKVVDCVGKFQ